MLAWCLGIFLAGQALLSPVFDYLLPEYRFPWFYRIIEHASRAKDTEAILCLGSSRFGTGLFAGEMTSQLRTATGSEHVLIINAGVPGGDYITSEKMLNSLLAQGVKPRLVLLEFCPELLNHTIGWLNLHTVRTLCWHDLKEFGSDLSTMQHLQRFVACRLFPLVQYRNFIRTRLQDRFLSKDTTLRSPQETLLAATDHHWIVELEQPAWPMERQMSELAGHFVKYEIGGQPVACLTRMLRRCKSEQIEVVLIEPPVTEAHQAFYTPVIEQQYEDYYQQLRTEYGTSRFRYRNAVPEEEFYDHHHCNRSGAHRWGQMVVQDVLAPSWIELTNQYR